MNRIVSLFLLFTLLFTSCMVSGIVNDQGISLFAEGSQGLQGDMYATWYSDSDVISLANKAADLNNEGKYEEALMVINEALKISPTGYARPWYNKGNILFNLKRYEEALKAYDFAIALDPTDSDAQYRQRVLDRIERISLENSDSEGGLFSGTEVSEQKKTETDDPYFWQQKAENLSDEGKLEEALEAYQAGLNEFPGDPSLLHNKAYLLDRMGRYEDALTAYDEAIKADPNDPYLLTSKAYVLSKMGKTSTAAELYDEAIRVAPPDNWQMWDYKADFFERTGELDEAIATLDKGRTLFPGNCDLMRSKARFLSSQKKDTEAISLLDQELENETHDQYCHQSLLNQKASLLSDMKRYDEALDMVNQGISKYPDNDQFFSTKVSVLIAMGDYSGALTVVEKRIAADPDDTGLLSSKANILSDLKRYDDAIEIWDTLIADEPGYSYLYGNRAADLQSLGRLDEALQSNEQGLMRNPTESWLIRQKASILSDMGKHDEALSFIITLLKENPNDMFSKYSWMVKGDILSTMGRNTEAAEAYTTALSLDSELEEAQEGLARVTAPISGETPASGNETLPITLQMNTTSQTPSIPLSPDDEIPVNQTTAVQNWIDLGNDLYAQGKYHQSLMIFEQALTLDPKNNAAQIGLDAARAKEGTSA